MKKITLFIGILALIATSVIIVGELFFLEPSYVNLAYVCFTSVIGYIVSAVYLITYFETKKIKNG
jgi:hypothetical protein